MPDPTPLRFVLTGLLVNGTLFLVLALILRLGVDYRLAVTVTYVLGMLWGYLQNRLWSWRSKAPVVQSVARYLAVYGGVYLAHMGIVSLLVERAGLWPLGAAAVSAAVLVIPLFLSLNQFVFPRPPT